MTNQELARQIRGKTIRFHWADGPTQGMTHEHRFNEDGTVEWRAVHGAEKGKPGHAPHYAAFRIAEDIYVVSYLAPSGYTLTAILNFKDDSLLGFASGGEEWHPCHGAIEVVER
jgi:hypothetical protein